jgi:hypothetical protein
MHRHLHQISIPVYIASFHFLQRSDCSLLACLPSGAAFIRFAVKAGIRPYAPSLAAEEIFGNKHIPENTEVPASLEGTPPSNERRLTMVKMQSRFQHCDQRFFPYLEKVLSRLPGEIASELLESTKFQIVASDDFQDACVLSRSFPAPLQTLVYVNTKILKEAEHMILLALASQVAFFVAGKNGNEVPSREAEELLKHWGFSNELDAVRYDQTVAHTESFRVGYNWAMHQDKDYLLTHFGLYRESWSTGGWGKPARDKGAETPDLPEEALPVLEEIMKAAAPEGGETKRRTETEAAEPKEAMLAGIMRALKEIEWLEQYNPQTCDIRSI